MRATKDLPTNYHHLHTLNLSSSRTVLWLNIAAVPLLFIFGSLFVRMINAFRLTTPFTSGFWGLVNAFSGWGLIAILASIVIMLVVHELIHGTFFWLFTRERPRFALRSGYAFAAAPEWFLPKLQYSIVGLSPLVVISIVCIIAAVFLPADLVPYPLFIATFNAAGALGDMIVVTWVIRQVSTVLVRDTGDRFSVFAPGSE